MYIGKVALNFKQTCNVYHTRSLNFKQENRGHPMAFSKECRKVPGTYSIAVQSKDITFVCSLAVWINNNKQS